MKRTIASICIISVLFTLFASLCLAAEKHADDCTCEECVICVKDKGLECHCPKCTIAPQWGGDGAKG